MTVQPLERDRVQQGDRYLAAYASVHSLLEEPGAQPVPGDPEPRSSAAPVTTDVAIPAARLAHSNGGRRKLKRRRFPFPGQPTAG